MTHHNTLCRIFSVIVFFFEYCSIFMLFLFGNHGSWNRSAMGWVWRVGSWRKGVWNVAATTLLRWAYICIYYILVGRMAWSRQQIRVQVAVQACELVLLVLFGSLSVIFLQSQRCTFSSINSDALASCLFCWNEANVMFVYPHASARLQTWVCRKKTQAPCWCWC